MGLFSLLATDRFRPAINCRIRLRLYYKSLIPPPALGKEKSPIFRRERCCFRHHRFSGSWRLLNDRTSQRSFVLPLVPGTAPFAVFCTQICADGFGRRRSRRRRLRFWPVAWAG